MLAALAALAAGCGQPPASPGPPLGPATSTATPTAATTDTPPSTAARVPLRVVDTIATSGFQQQFALDGAADRLYVSDCDKDFRVRVIDTTSRKTIGTIKVADGHPGVCHLALDAPAKRLYATGLEGYVIWVIDTARGRVIDRITTGRKSWAMVADPGTNRLYVSNDYRESLTVLDTASKEVLGVVEGPSGELALDAAGARLYVLDTKRLTVLDTASGEVVATVRMGDNMRALALDPAERRAYAVDIHDGTVPGTLWVLDTATNAVIDSTLEIPGDRVALDPARKWLYTGRSYGGRALTVVDTTAGAVAGEVVLGSVRELLVDEDTHLVYLSADPPDADDVHESVVVLEAG